MPLVTVVESESYLFKTALFCGCCILTLTDLPFKHCMCYAKCLLLVVAICNAKNVRHLVHDLTVKRLQKSPPPLSPDNI